MGSFRIHMLIVMGFLLYSNALWHFLERIPSMANEQITVVAIVKAKQGIESQVRDELSAMVAPTRQEPGCISYDLHIDSEDPSLFMFHETWNSKEDLDTHIQAPPLQQLLKKADDLFAKPLDVSIWKKIS